MEGVVDIPCLFAWEEGPLPDGLRSAGLGNEPSWGHPTPERWKALCDDGLYPVEGAVGLEGESFWGSVWHIAWEL